MTRSVENLNGMSIPSATSFVSIQMPERSMAPALRRDVSLIEHMEAVMPFFAAQRAVLS